MSLAKCKHLLPRLTGFKFTTTSAPAATVDKGSNDFTSISRSSAGKAVATQAELGLFARGPLVIASPGANIAAGGFAMLDTLPGSGAITVELADAAGAGDDGTGYAIALGFGSLDTDRYTDEQIVKSTLCAPELLAWRITNNGTVAVASGGRQASVARSSAGVVVLTLTPAKAQIRAAVATAVSASCRSANVAAFTGDSITINTTDAAGVATDSDFIVFALVSGNSDESGRRLDELTVPQISPELVAGRVTVTAGTPAVTIGGATHGVDFTVTDNGVGDFTITLSAAFLRACLPIPTAKDNRAQLIATPDSSSFRVGIFNAAGAAADDSFDFILVGYNATSAHEF